MEDYNKQAEDFLTSHNLEFRAVLVGDDCPTFCDDAEADRDMDKVNTFPRRSHIHGKHYRCTISGKDRGHFSIDFWNSYNDEERNFIIKAPYGKAIPFDLYKKHGLRYESFTKGKVSTVRAYDVLACLTKSEPGSFQNFCMDYGYDNDSIKHKEVYEAVIKEWAKVSKFFTAEELEQLREIQ